MIQYSYQSLPIARNEFLECARAVGPACVLTTATTGAAFLSFVASDLDTFQRFGPIAAFGVSACLVLTFSLLPITVTASPVEIQLPNGGLVRLPVGVGHAVIVEVIRAVTGLQTRRKPLS